MERLIVRLLLRSTLVILTLLLLWILYIECGTDISLQITVLILFVKL